jgi:hypothetical protein
MKPLAVFRTDRPTGRAGALRLDHVRIPSHDRPLSGGECGSPSRAFGEFDAKDGRGRPHHNRPANLKPNIYYKAQDFTLGTYWVPGRPGASRADHRLTGPTGEDSEPAGPGVNARQGPTETSPAPDSAARAACSFGEPARGMAEDAACDC